MNLFLFLFFSAGLLALTVGPGEKAQEILEESLSPISDALRIRSEATKALSVRHILIVQFRLQFVFLFMDA